MGINFKWGFQDEKKGFCIFCSLFSLILSFFLIFQTVSLDKKRVNFSSDSNFSKSILNNNQFSSFKIPCLNYKKEFKESLDLIIIEDSVIKSTLPPVTVTPQIMGSLIEGSIVEPEEEKREVIEYEIKKGENLSQIAEKFKISLETILWANNLNPNSKIEVGQKLIILPVSGVLHYVKANDTLSQISEKYQADLKEIIAFNDLKDENDIFIGDILIIPGGKIKKSSPKPSPFSIPFAKSYFICPIGSPCQISQGLHWYNAVDFSRGKCGEAVYAAASGKVLKVKTTESASKSALGGLGNHITILHPNGLVTLYAHLLSVFVNPGDEVSQGEIIGLIGGQPGSPGAGRSTGCHLHFSVNGGKNPFAK